MPRPDRIAGWKVDCLDALACAVFRPTSVADSEAAILDCSDVWRSPIWRRNRHCGMGRVKMVRLVATDGADLRGRGRASVGTRIRNWMAAYKGTVSGRGGRELEIGTAD